MQIIYELKSDGEFLMGIPKNMKQVFRYNDPWVEEELYFKLKTIEQVSVYLLTFIDELSFCFDDTRCDIDKQHDNQSCDFIIEEASLLRDVSSSLIFYASSCENLSISESLIYYA